MSENNKSISLANIVSVIGIVILTLGWFISIAYISFNMVSATIAALAVALISSLLLTFAIRFRQVDSAESQWKVLQYIFLSLLCLVFVASIFPFSHYINIQKNKESLSQSALNDVNAIRSEIANFKSYEQDALTRTCIGLSDAFSASGSGVGDGLKKYMQENHLTGIESVESFKSQKSDRIDNITLPNTDGSPGASSYNEVWQSSLDNAEAVIKAWSVFRIPSAIDLTESVASNVAEILPLMENQLIFPEIKKENSVYDTVDSANSLPTVNYSPHFRNDISQLGYFNILGLLCAFFIGAIILFNFFIVPPSKRVAISKDKTNSAGQLL